MTLACIQSRLTPAEALRAATIGAARAIAMADTLGSLEPGKRADLALLDAPSLAHWLYHFKPNVCRQTYVGGRPASDS